MSIGGLLMARKPTYEELEQKVKELEKKDILRLKKIAKKFSGSVFVFSTMKERLSSSEKKLIQSFALWGREYNEYGESRAPIIVLTAKELFARYKISLEWKKKGGKHASLIESAFILIQTVPIYARSGNVCFVSDTLLDYSQKHGIIVSNNHV